MVVEAQEWLDHNYSIKHECANIEDKENKGKKRGEVKKLKIVNPKKKLEGNLKIEGFSSLETIDLSGNNLKSLEINGSHKLEKIYFRDSSSLNQLTIEDCPHISFVDIDSNNLNNLEFLKKLYEVKLEYLNISRASKGDFSGTSLNIFAKFTNLIVLRMGNGNFYGSLRLLESLNKLKALDISGTLVDNDLEYLPKSLKWVKFKGCEEIEKRVAGGKKDPERIDKEVMKKIKDIAPDCKEWYNFSEWYGKNHREITYAFTYRKELVENLSLNDEGEYGFRDDVSLVSYAQSEQSTLSSRPSFQSSRFSSDLLSPRPEYEKMGKSERKELVRSRSSNSREKNNRIEELENDKRRLEGEKRVLESNNKELVDKITSLQTQVHNYNVGSGHVLAGNSIGDGSNLGYSSLENKIEIPPKQ